MPKRNDPEIKKYTLKNGKTKYMFKTYLGIDPETHKAKKVTRRGFDSWTEAQTAKTQLKAQGVAGAKNQQKEKTLQEVWDVWFEIYKQDKRGSTIVGTKLFWNNHIKPEFGNSYVNNISPEHIQKYIIDLSKNYISYRRIINLLHKLIQYSLKQDWCETDPFLKVDIPKKSAIKSNKSKNNYLTKEEFYKFIERIKQRDYKQYTFIMILASLGLRNGEALALKWKDVDFDNKSLNVSHSISKKDDGSKNYGATKNTSSVRTLPLSDNLKEILLTWKKQTLYPKSNDFIIPSLSGDFITPSYTNKWFNSFFKKNPDLHQITPHGLRHTLATLLQGSDNIGPKDVQYLLGHSNVQTTLDIYTHITEQNKKNVESSIKKLGL